MEQKNSLKKTIITLFGVAVGIVALAFIQHFAFNTPSFDKVMMQTASELNKSCPMMVDRETRLDNAMALPDNVFQYNYTLVNVVKDSIDIQRLENSLKPRILNFVKTNPDLIVQRDNRVTMAYYYQDKNGEFITKISIAPSQYEN